MCFLHCYCCCFCCCFCCFLFCFVPLRKECLIALFVYRAMSGMIEEILIMTETDMIHTTTDMTHTPGDMTRTTGPLPPNRTIADPLHPQSLMKGGRTLTPTGNLSTYTCGLLKLSVGSQCMLIDLKNKSDKLKQTRNTESYFFPLFK